MTIHRIALTAVCTIMGVVALAAPSPVGTWSGHMTFKIPASATPQMKQQMAAQAPFLAKMKISVTFKKDHTFTFTVGGAGGPKTGHSDTGKWKESGDSVILTGANHPDKPQTLTMSKGGKQMTIVQGPVTVIFSR